MQVTLEKKLSNITFKEFNPQKFQYSSDEK